MIRDHIAALARLAHRSNPIANLPDIRDPLSSKWDDIPYEPHNPRELTDLHARDAGDAMVKLRAAYTRGDAGDQYSARAMILSRSAVWAMLACALAVGVALGWAFSVWQGL